MFSPKCLKRFGFFSTGCLSIKYGEKILKNWSETRQSLNQKCLDKKKQHLKKIKRTEDDRA